MNFGKRFASSAGREINWYDPGVGYDEGQRGNFYHEIGHVFDREVLTERDRQEFRRIMGRTGPWWGGAEPIGEWFSMAYSLLALGQAQPNQTWWGYGYAPTKRQQAQVNRLIRRAARRRRPLAKARWTEALHPRDEHGRFIETFTSEDRFDLFIGGTKFESGLTGQEAEAAVRTARGHPSVKNAGKPPSIEVRRVAPKRKVQAISAETADRALALRRERNLRRRDAHVIAGVNAKEVETELVNAQANRQQLSRWHPGTWGKAYITTDGEVVTWSTTPQGAPHHYGLADVLRDAPFEPRDFQVAATFVIAPSGEFTSDWGPDVRPGIVDLARAVERENPGMTFEESNIDWIEANPPPGHDLPPILGRNVQGIEAPAREARIAALEREKAKNLRELDRLRFHGGSTAATTNAIDRRLAQDRKITMQLAELEGETQPLSATAIAEATRAARHETHVVEPSSIMVEDTFGFTSEGDRTIILEDWEPGNYGKGLVFPNGDVIRWSTTGAGGPPAHVDVATALGVPTTDPPRLYIDPDGSARVSYPYSPTDADHELLIARWGSPTAIKAKFLAAYPDLAELDVEISAISPETASRQRAIVEARRRRGQEPMKPTRLIPVRDVDVAEEVAAMEDAVANGGSTQLWEPGTWGKGMEINGEIYTWPTQSPGEGMGPHHDQMEEAAGYPEGDPMGLGHMIVIAPDGEYTGVFGDWREEQLVESWRNFKALITEAKRERPDDPFQGPRAFEREWEDTYGGDFPETEEEVLDLYREGFDYFANRDLTHVKSEQEWVDRNNPPVGHIPGTPNVQAIAGGGDRGPRGSSAVPGREALFAALPRGKGARKYGRLVGHKRFVRESERAIAKAKRRYPMIRKGEGPGGTFTGFTAASEDRKRLVRLFSDHPEIGEKLSDAAVSDAILATVTTGGGPGPTSGLPGVDELLGVGQPREIKVLINDLDPDHARQAIDEEHPAAIECAMSPATRDPEGRMLHEMGHVSAGLAGVTEEQVIDALARSGLIEPFEPDILGHEPSTREWQDFDTRPLEDLTFYASTTPSEALAELFAMKNHPDAWDDAEGWPPEERPRIDAMIEEFAKALNESAGVKVI